MLLTIYDLKDKKLGGLIVKYRYTQIQEDHEYEYGDEYSKEDAIREALKAEHDLVEYLRELIKD